MPTYVWRRWNPAREAADESRKCLQRISGREEGRDGGCGGGGGGGGRGRWGGGEPVSLMFSKYHMTAAMWWKLPPLNYLFPKPLRKNMSAISEMCSRGCAK